MGKCASGGLWVVELAMAAEAERSPDFSGATGGTDNALVYGATIPAVGARLSPGRSSSLAGFSRSVILLVNGQGASPRPLSTEPEEKNDS